MFTCFRFSAYWEMVLDLICIEKTWFKFYTYFRHFNLWFDVMQFFNLPRYTNTVCEQAGKKHTITCCRCFWFKLNIIAEINENVSLDIFLLNLPFKDNYFWFIYCIQYLYEHFPWFTPPGIEYIKDSKTSIFFSRFKNFLTKPYT